MCLCVIRPVLQCVCTDTHRLCDVPQSPLVVCSNHVLLKHLNTHTQVTFDQIYLLPKTKMAAMSLLSPKCASLERPKQHITCLPPLMHPQCFGVMRFSQDAATGVCPRRASPAESDRRGYRHGSGVHPSVCRPSCRSVQTLCSRCSAGW